MAAPAPVLAYLAAQVTELRILQPQATSAAARAASLTPVMTLRVRGEPRLHFDPI